MGSFIIGFEWDKVFDQPRPSDHDQFININNQGKPKTNMLKTLIFMIDSHNQMDAIDEPT